LLSGCRHLLDGVPPEPPVLLDILRCPDLLRGLDKVRSEWSLVTRAWNIKRMFALTGVN
jgi:hypothetical protein